MRTSVSMSFLVLSVLMLGCGEVGFQKSEASQVNGGKKDNQKEERYLAGDQKEESASGEEAQSIACEGGSTEVSDNRTLKFAALTDVEEERVDAPGHISCGESEELVPAAERVDAGK